MPSERRRAEPFIESFADASGSKQLGAEKRPSILPKSGSDLNYKAPSYDYGAAVPMPTDINVKSGDSMESVMNAVKGMAYYTDVIGFGQSSSALTSDMEFSPLGINYFMPSYTKCPNGATMWKYVTGIPQGNALGDTVKKAFEKQGFPALKGLAPGMVEDAKVALNPSPYIQAIIGDPYPDCQQATLQVGDAKGNISAPDGKQWISGDYQINGSGQKVQTKWIQKTDAGGNLVFIDRATAMCVPKTLNPDGTPNPEPPELDSFCTEIEGFTTQDTMSLLLAAVLLGIAVFIKSSR